MFSSGTSAAADLDTLLELSLEELMEFRVTAPTRTDIELAKAPGSVTLITRDQILSSPARTIPELLRSAAGVNVRWNTMVQTVDIRSFGSNPFTSRVLLMIDGVPYNSWNKGGFPQHPGFDFFNLDYINYIEVMRGPGAAHAENAFNGLINIVTLKGTEQGAGRIRVLSGDDETMSFSASQGLRIPDGSLFVGARKFEGVMPTVLWEDNGTGTTQGYDLFAKLVWREWQMSYYRISDALDGFVNRFGSAVFRSADKVEQTVDVASIKRAFTSEDGRWSADVQASRAERDGSHCGACHARSQDPGFASPVDHGFQNYAEAYVGFKADDRHSLLAGVEWRKVSAGDYGAAAHIGGAITAPGHDPVFSYRKYAAYLQDHMTFDRLQIIAGVRYDSATSPRVFDAEVLPRLDVVYRHSDTLTLRAQWGRSVRYPSFSEQYQSSWFVNGEFPGGLAVPFASFVPNAEIQPEYIETLSLGAEAMPSRNSRVRLELYRNVIDDYITIAYPRIRFENHPQDAVVHGFEADFLWELSKIFTVSGNYSYQWHQRRGNGVDTAGNALDFSYAPRHKVNLAFDFVPLPGVSGRLDVLWKDEYRAPDYWYRIVNGGQGQPLDAYTLINLRLDYLLPIDFQGRQPFRLSVFGKNLGNERVPETLLGVSASLTGRSAFLQLEYVLE